MSDYSDKIIYGKNTLENVVSVEASDGHLEVFTEKDGVVASQFIENKYWVLANVPLSKGFIQLQGNLHYKYGIQFDNRKDFMGFRQRHKKNDIYSIYDSRESSLINKGITYYKNMQPKDVSILAFDIESTGLKHDDTSKVLLIANTFRKNGVLTRKLFAYDDYKDEGEMIYEWCKWVRQINPSILCGHNIFLYDIPYLRYVADKFGVTLELGRDGSELEYYKYSSKFRADGNREQEYYNVRCYGREIFDSYFALIRYDIEKKLESYGLKPAIKHFGLEVKDRVFYDASQIRFKYKDPIEWEKIRNYAIMDGDDALNLSDVIMPTTFYMTQTIPKTFQQIILSASGSQINSMLIRSYLQNGHSIPKADEIVEKVSGGLSFAIPGIYRNVVKADLKSAYPTQIIKHSLFEPSKDPNGNYLYITKYFTYKRFELKDLYKKTKDELIKSQDNAAKTTANSMYGAANTSGLNFNSQKLASMITGKTRDILKTSIEWAKGDIYENWKVSNKLEELM